MRYGSEALFMWFLSLPERVRERERERERERRGVACVFCRYKGHNVQPIRGQCGRRLQQQHGGLHGGLQTRLRAYRLSRRSLRLRGAVRDERQPWGGGGGGTLHPLRHLRPGSDRKLSGHRHLRLLQAFQVHDGRVPAQRSTCRSAVCGGTAPHHLQRGVGLDHGPCGLQAAPRRLQCQPVLRHAAAGLHQHRPLRGHRPGQAELPAALCVLRPGGLRRGVAPGPRPVLPHLLLLRHLPALAPGGVPLPIPGARGLRRDDGPQFNGGNRRVRVRVSFPGQRDGSADEGPGAQYPDGGGVFPPTAGDGGVLQQHHRYPAADQELPEAQGGAGGAGGGGRVHPVSPALQPVPAGGNRHQVLHAELHVRGQRAGGQDGDQDPGVPALLPEPRAVRLRGREVQEPLQEDRGGPVVPGEEVHVPQPLLQGHLRLLRVHHAALRGRIQRRQRLLLHHVRTGRKTLVFLVLFIAIFSPRFSSCQLKGYFTPKIYFFLSISHPMETLIHGYLFSFCRIPKPII